MLENYEDDYSFDENVTYYYPTYQVLSDSALRGYFSWRTKVRKGSVEKTSATFAYLYIYELINQIGVSSPQDGYDKLVAFQNSYGQLDSILHFHLEKWIFHYVIYYNLDSSLLASTHSVMADHQLAVLDRIQEHDTTAVLDAVKILAPKWLTRSKFYRTHTDDCNIVIDRVLRCMSEHYTTRTSKSLLEYLFCKSDEIQVRMFDSAVFCDPLKIRDSNYVVDELCVYRCNAGLWTATGYHFYSTDKLENLLRAIDGIMRELYGDRYPIRYSINTKWQEKLIRQEVQALLEEKQRKSVKKMNIDYTLLERIRQESAITQDRLTVEEDSEDSDPVSQPISIPDTQTDSTPASDYSLTSPEIRLLHCLLYGEPLNWVQENGYLLSVLADGINEKLYDSFQDSVLDDTPRLIEDYIDDLKEIILP